MTHNPVFQKLEEAIEDLIPIPLWGSPPLFPLEAFADALAQSFEVESLSLELKKTDWSKSPLDGLGQAPLIRPFVLSPLPCEFFFAMAQNDLRKLTTSLLSKEEKGLSEDTLIRGFADVALLNACQTFNELNPFGGLSASFADDTPLSEEGSLCIDFSIKIATKTLRGRIIASRECLNIFRNYFDMEKPPFAIDSSNATLPISLWYEAGSTKLFVSEWKSAKVGDCVLLDRCTIDIQEGKGTAILLAGQTPLFDIRIKGDEAKILDYAMTQKENPMTDQIPENPAEVSAEPEPKPLPTDRIPLTLTVELGRFQMPLEKVSQLQPGNVLDLHKTTETHVHLTIGGKRIAMGELVSLGEMMGVKILKLGD